jgi:CRISPR-associated protein Cas1
MSFLTDGTVGYREIQTSWGPTLLLKVRGLAHLAGKTKELEFVLPEFGGQRVDSHEIRQKILNISYSDWKKLGFSKGLYIT